MMSAVERVHPGTIELIDGDTGHTIDRIDQAEMAEDAKWEKTENGWVPIVRVVATEGDGGRRLEMFGPDGQLLRTVRDGTA